MQINQSKGGRYSGKTLPPSYAAVTVLTRNYGVRNTGRKYTGLLNVRWPKLTSADVRTFHLDPTYRQHCTCYRLHGTNVEFACLPSCYFAFIIQTTLKTPIINYIYLESLNLMCNLEITVLCHIYPKQYIISYITLP